VTRLADELATDARRGQLEAGLAAVSSAAETRPALREALAVLRADPELAWRAYAAALLANELAD
jgi:hypothetical protein